MLNRRDFLWYGSGPQLTRHGYLFSRSSRGHANYAGGVTLYLLQT